VANHRGSETALVGMLAVLLLGISPAGLADEAGQTWTSQAGLYRVRYKSELEPIEINKMHDWVLHVETAKGTPVVDAAITLTGGMPAHNHGMPTQPQVTKNMGHGDYRVEGMRFHMAGDWVITLTIDAAAGKDTCTIPLKL
jgi:hypothetical protein